MCEFFLIWEGSSYFFFQIFCFLHSMMVGVGLFTLCSTLRCSSYPWHFSGGIKYFECFGGDDFVVLLDCVLRFSRTCYKYTHTRTAAVLLCRLWMNWVRRKYRGSHAAAGRRRTRDHGNESAACCCYGLVLRLQLLLLWRVYCLCTRRRQPAPLVEGWKHTDCARVSTLLPTSLQQQVAGSED